MVPAQNPQAASVEMMPEDTLVALSRLFEGPESMSNRPGSDDPGA